MRKRKTRSDDAEINVTPLLDIVFIMLIFFIVTTSFVREFGIDANHSTNAPDTIEDTSESILVRIENDGQIFVRDRRTDIRLVQANIESILSAMPGAVVVVAASRSADAGILVRVVDQARVAGAEQVSMMGLDN